MRFFMSLAFLFLMARDRNAVYQPPPELVADFDRRNAEALQRFNAKRPERLSPSVSITPVSEVERAENERQRRDHRALAICEARRRMAGVQVQDACLEAYRATGILPSY
jgi:hypothetical protein